MGWLAAGCCSAIAGYFLCRLLIQATTPDSDKAGLRQRFDPSPSLLVKEAEHARPAPEVTFNELKVEPTFEISTPTMQISLPNDGPFKEKDGNSSDKTQETVTLSMPPPPPMLNRGSEPPRLKPPSLSAPPRPGNGFVRPPPSAAASLRVPVTKPLPNASLAPSSSIMPPGKQVSRKVVLEPGHSPLDWAALTNNPNNHLRGKDAPGDGFLRITPTELKRQNGRKGKDAWTVYQGKVYNITPYVPFHPGGAGEILRGAGKDSVKLFMEVHPWVNWDGMLSECLVGILVSEDEAARGSNGSLDEMD
ncbi:hypothetical protein H2200_013065 [Cladophialophora chaetospira]|uniref:Cytochrome b5 heme-binding domain-containing protein n=1 Tax=Cladophialophora chaetospira TaxID=386627 RepID=A0AA38WWS3_9EURO|nr:hypothetical protein H2200_013065 [Cladophialophora chaetospira]